MARKRKKRARAVLRDISSAYATYRLLKARFRREFFWDQRLPPTFTPKTSWFASLATVPPVGSDISTVTFHTFFSGSISSLSLFSAVCPVDFQTSSVGTPTPPLLQGNVKFCS